MDRRLLFQLPLPLESSTSSLRKTFEAVTGKPVSIRLVDNSSTLITVTENDGALNVRLHWMFTRAGQDVIDELSRYIKGGRGKTPLVSAFIKEHTHLMRPAVPRRHEVRTAGRHHDLAAIFDSVNSTYFDGKMDCTVSWGRRPAGRRARYRTLGSYYPESNTIRISPLLDSKRVPRYFVEYVLYHEMLHAKLGFEPRDGKNYAHTAKFRRLEQRFPHYERAVQWQKKNGF